MFNALRLFKSYYEGNEIERLLNHSETARSMRIIFSHRERNEFSTTQNAGRFAEPSRSTRCHPEALTEHGLKPSIVEENGL